MATHPYPIPPYIVYAHHTTSTKYHNALPHCSVARIIFFYNKKVSTPCRNLSRKRAFEASYRMMPNIGKETKKTISPPKPAKRLVCNISIYSVLAHWYWQKETPNTYHY